MAKNKLLRMDNVGIVVESLDDAISFFKEIGLELEGRATVEGEWAGRVTGLGSQNVEIAPRKGIVVLSLQLEIAREDSKSRLGFPGAGVCLDRLECTQRLGAL